MPHETRIPFYYTTVEFYGGGERVINEFDDIELGLIRPPWWPRDAGPPEWPPPRPLRRKFARMDDTWTSRDLPVLKAVVELYEQTGRAKIRLTEVARAAGLDDDTTRRAVRALYTEPYFEEGLGSAQVDILFVGKPTSAALRVAGQWPTPENMVEKLIAAFQDAAEDEDLAEPERTRARKVLDGLLSGGSKIAIAALGSAGGHYLSS